MGVTLVSSDVNYDTGNEVYIIGDTKTDEAGFQEFLDRFTPVCSMDILGNYTGNVITFEEFLQKLYITEEEKRCATQSAPTAMSMTQINTPFAPTAIRRKQRSSLAPVVGERWPLAARAVR